MTRLPARPGEPAGAPGLRTVPLLPPDQARPPENRVGRGHQIHPHPPRVERSAAGVVSAVSIPRTRAHRPMAGTSRLRPANSSPRRVFHRRRWRSGGTSRPRPCPAPRSSVSCPNSGRYGGGATLPGHCAPRLAHHRPAVPRHGSGRRSAARGAASRAGLRHEHVAGAEQIPGPVHAGDSVTRSDGRIRGDTYRAAVLRVGDSGADQVAGHPDRGFWGRP